MELNEFKKRLFKRAEKAGFTAFEIYYSKADKFELSTYDNDIDNYSTSSTFGINFRGLYNNKIGLSSTEILDEASVDILIDNALSNASVIENDDKKVIFDGKKQKYEEINNYSKKLGKMTPEERINILLEIYGKVKEYASEKTSAALKNVISEFEYEEREWGIANSNGLELSHKANYAIIFTECVMEKDGAAQSDYAYRFCKKRSELSSIDDLAKKALDNTIARFDGDTVQSSKYDLIINNKCFASLLQTFSGIFSAENAQKGLSLLKGKVGSKIGVPALNIVDDPFLPSGIFSEPFDAEGVATYKKTVIQNGELLTLLYDLKAAIKDGVKSTGNASKASYASDITISPSNFYVEPGNAEFEELLKNVNNGILITNLEGLHAGANAETGDFSLSAKGFEIKDGTLGKAVEQITVSSNFYDILKNIELIGKDLDFCLPNSNGYFGSPSIVVKNISIAGK